MCQPGQIPRATPGKLVKAPGGAGQEYSSPGLARADVPGWARGVLT